MANDFVPPARVGFVGLGNMGAPMARRLAAAGYRLMVADAVPAAVERFRADVPCDAPGLAEIGAGCRLVITMLPDGHAVRSVLLGDGGIASGLKPGAVVLDMTSASPVGTRALGAELAARGITLLDAPVSGGVGRAVEGKLAIMAGGDAAEVARCRPILEVLGQVFLTGAPGSGHAMKALNNFLSAIALAAAGEAMLAGERFGLDPAVMIKIFNASTGRNTATDHKYPKFVLPRTFDSGFALGLMAKDLRLALELSHDTGAPAELLQTCVDMWTRAEQDLGFRADNTEIVKYLESRMLPSRAMVESEPFEVYAIRYATVARRGVENYIGGDPHESQQMDYFVWLARNSQHTVVIDTGFDSAAAVRRQRQFLRSPGEGLRLLGVDPAHVREVIITHLHYDHAGNLGLFPRARFHLQDREMAYATGRYMGLGFFSHAYEADDVVAAVRMVYGGRVLFHDGDGRIVPGMTVHHIGGHTRGLQAVRVWTRVGWLVLASDAAHYSANMIESRPFPIVADVTEMADGWRKLRTLASAEEHIVPGHDPSVMLTYRAPTPELQGIAVRLDEKPLHPS